MFSAAGITMVFSWHRVLNTCRGIPVTSTNWRSAAVKWMTRESTASLLRTLLERRRKKLNSQLNVSLQMIVRAHLLLYFCPPPFAKAGDIKNHSSICPSVCLSVSVTKTLTWLISSDVLMIEHWYLACKIFVTSPLHWYHVVTLTLTLWPTSRSNLLPGGRPQFFEFACCFYYARVVAFRIGWMS